jgi:hypothetical protein
MTKNKTKVTLQKQIQKWIAEASTEWFDRYKTKEQVFTKVHEILDKDKLEIIAKILGFDNHWGEWEVDHCNGRSGNTFVGQYLTDTVKASVNDWLRITLGNLPKLNKEMINALHKEYIAEFHRVAHSLIKEEASDRAAKLIRQIVRQEITKNTAFINLKDYKKEEEEESY